MWVKLLIALLVVAGISVWLRDKAEPVSLEGAGPAAVAEAVDADPFAGVGLLVRYQTTDIPVFYLLYETQSGRFLRKELRFTDERGCNPLAGDLPCVLSTSANPAPVPIGSVVRVTGEVDAQRILVDTIDVVSGSERFELVTVGVRETGTGGDMDVTVLDIYEGGGCEVFVGCFKEGIPRVSLRVTSDGDTREDTVIPGMVKVVPKGAVVVVWADKGQGEAVIAIAHQAKR